MNHNQIQFHEADFLRHGIDSDGKQFNRQTRFEDLPTWNRPIAIVELDCGDHSFYYDECVQKKQITLHHTAGYLKGDIAQLTPPNKHVSTPYVIARDGTIYELFSPTKWAYHLGKGAAGGNEPRSKGSIAIELSNIGALLPQGDYLVAAENERDTYCHHSDISQYIALDAPYRGYTYFATYTTEQYTSLAKLLDLLTSKFNIPNTFLTEPYRFDTLTEQQAIDFNGILAHVNFRKIAKTDLSPAFDYPRLIGLCGATTQEPPSEPSTEPLAEPNYSLKKTIIV
jgi:N-acetylmuramoyl-L-alanine amidase